MSADPITTAAGSTAEASRGGARTGLDVRHLSWMRPLAGDYAFNFPHVAELYAGDPSKAESWRDAIRRTQRHERDHEAVAGLIAAQQQRRGAPPEARAAAARLADPRTVAVVTGQQAGVFGGPLFTLLKAVTAIQLARKAEQEQAVPAVPVFWVDAEDHDWEEVRSCTVLDASYQPQTITLSAPEGAGDRPVAALTLDDRIEESLSALARALPQTDFTPWLLAALQKAYRPGIGVADAFARWLETLLGAHGLIVFESSDAAAKPLVAEVFAREFRDPGKAAALASAAGDALAARGHEPQVMPQAESVAVFHLEGGRQSIRKEGDRFVVGETTRTIESLAAEAAAHPSRFSPNVLLRPIVQDTLFPTICYVAGPSELAYLGQLSGVYREFGVPMPLMYPRATATLVDSAAARFIAKYDVPLDDLQRQDESALNRLLQSQLPPAVDESLKAAGDAIHRTMQRAIEAMPALDPTLAGAARTTLGKMEHDLRGLQSKVIHAAKRRDETLRRQFTRAQAQIFPLGQPQERTLGVVFFLNRYGPGLVERLLEELPLELGQHWLMAV